MQTLTPQEKKVCIFFLCTGKSCRSQMAEGWARHLKGEEIEAYSASTEPQAVNPRATQVMREAGVDISGQRSKHVTELLDEPFGCVVTLCGGAQEACPVFPGKVKPRRVGFEDTAVATGTERGASSLPQGPGSD